MLGILGLGAIFVQVSEINNNKYYTIQIEYKLNGIFNLYFLEYLQN